MKKLISLLFVLFILTACSDEGQLIKYQGNYITWEKTSIPISVFYTNTFDPVLADTLRSTALYMNSQFGAMFTYPSEWLAAIIPEHAIRGSVFFRPTDAMNEDEDLAFVSHNIDADNSTIASADAWIRPTDDFLKNEALRHYILMHELGHVLGLAHDADPCSIMFPYVEGRCSYTKRYWETADIDVIRQTYAK